MHNTIRYILAAWVGAGIVTGGIAAIVGVFAFLIWFDQHTNDLVLVLFCFAVLGAFFGISYEHEQRVKHATHPKD